MQAKISVDGLFRVLFGPHVILRRRRKAYARKNKKTSVAARKHYLLHKQLAHDRVHGALLEIAAFYGVVIERVQIRDQRTRWGSCSRKGNLNFNYRVLFLPPHLFEYVVVHEVCHLVEFNHSEEFWAQVARRVPEHRAHRQELRLIERYMLTDTETIVRRFNS